MYVYIYTYCILYIIVYPSITTCMGKDDAKSTAFPDFLMKWVEVNWGA